MFGRTSKLSWEQVRESADKYRATIERLTPEIYSEIVGIAEGAGLDVLDIVALNCRSEIALGQFSDGCTSVSYRNPGDGYLLAQNWDWSSVVQKNLALVSIEQQDGKPGIRMVTEAGIVGKIGFNTCGVGTCLNAIRAKPVIFSKLPIHIALRICLNSKSVDDAIQAVSSLGGVASSQHILIADPTKSLGLELSPLGNVYLHPDENRMIYHTNHFLENRFVHEPPWLDGSPIRLERATKLARELVSAGAHSITPSMLRQKVFCDTHNTPQSICCQEDLKKPPIQRARTLFNIVMNLDPNDLGAEVVMGQPGSGKESSVLRL